MLQLSAAGKRYGHKLLFEGADWMITPRDRVGLVGANGTGKSTLLKILAGSESLDYGSVSRAKGISAGYLPQDGLALSGRTVFAECMSVFSQLRKMEQEMEELTGRMSELDHASPEYSQVAQRYQRIEHEFTTRGGYASRWSSSCCSSPTCCCSMNPPTILISKPATGWRNISATILTLLC